MPTNAPCFKPSHRSAPPCTEYQSDANDRGSSADQGYNARWRNARAAWLAAHPFCVHCEFNNRVTLATIVDHIIPHKGDPILFWDTTNWQSLCKPHHDRKTAMKDGGFGRNTSNHPRRQPTA